MIRRFAAACRVKWCLVAFTVTGALVLTACGPRPVAMNASLSFIPATPAAATSPAEVPPSTAPLPFAKTAPVAVAGWQTLTSTNWDGYTFPVSGVTGVRAEWTQPSATGPSGSRAVVWVGIGGWNEPDLIQAGTSDFPPHLGVTYDGTWYELLPANPRYPYVSVVPGDKIAVSIVQAGSTPDKWRISVDDMSGDVTYAKTVEYDSSGTYPSFIVEDPALRLDPYGPYAPFAHWGKVSFANMQIRIGDEWKAAASIYGYRIELVRDGSTLATAGPLGRTSGFTARQEP